MIFERTLLIIKPDAIARNVVGEILARFEKSGFRILAAKMLHLSKGQAEKLYEVHKQRPFYEHLVKFMTSGPVMVQVLEGEDAIAKNRELIGATIPRLAAPGTVRYDFAKHEKDSDVYENAVHSSDSAENAEIEIGLFFEPKEICPRTR